MKVGHNMRDVKFQSVKETHKLSTSNRLLGERLGFTKLQFMLHILFNKLRIIGTMIMLILNTNTIFVFVRDHFGFAVMGSHLRTSPIGLQCVASVPYERITRHHQFRCASLTRHEDHIFHVTHRISWKQNN